MSTSIPGGATLAADGKTWQDAAGKPLDKTQIAAIEDLHADRTAQRNLAEAQRLAAEAKSNPIASALMALLSGQRAAPSPTGTATADPAVSSTDPDAAHSDAAQKATKAKA